MAETAEKTNQATETVTLNSIEGAKFAKGATMVVNTSLAYNGDARSAGKARKVKMIVDLSGVPLSKFAQSVAGQLRVDFQRSRRDAESNGVFKSEEAFNEYLTEVLGIDLEDEKSVGKIKLHYNVVGHAPAQKLTEDEAEAQFDQLATQMSDEDLQAILKKRGLL